MIKDIISLKEVPFDEWISALENYYLGMQSGNSGIIYQRVENKLIKGGPTCEPSEYFDFELDSKTELDWRLNDGSRSFYIIERDYIEEN
jgi:hypothetical protein